MADVSYDLVVERPVICVSDAGQFPVCDNVNLRSGVNIYVIGLDAD